MTAIPSTTPVKPHQDGISRPTFSVIVPTRDRPVLFRAALESVLGQADVALEVIVINDGSTPAFHSQYADIERTFAGTTERPVRYVHLEHLPKGHGQSYALNTGAGNASGRYLCFLDDDDVWTDMGHLARAQVLVDAAAEPDLLLFDQAAFREDGLVTQPIWLEDLGIRLRANGSPAGHGYNVTPEQLLTATGFCHVNTTVIGAGLFHRIGGLNESLFYECDRDFYLRAIDAAKGILYCPEVVARHNIPDPVLGASMSTRARPLEKRLCQFILLNHAAFTSRHPAIRDHARRHRRYAVLKALKACRSLRDYGRIGSAVARSIGREMTGRWGGPTDPIEPQTPG